MRRGFYWKRRNRDPRVNRDRQRWNRWARLSRYLRIICGPWGLCWWALYRCRAIESAKPDTRDLGPNRVGREPNSAHV